jgi:hypothetical protein
MEQSPVGLVDDVQEGFRGLSGRHGWWVVGLVWFLVSTASWDNKSSTKEGLWIEA